MNRTVKAVAAAALMAALLWFALPTTLGGQTSYVSTHGVSMEPMFQAGDLAILRPADSYQIGDVVLYRSDPLATDVMHRIADAKGGRFILQGDNNDWLDPDQPREEEILGELMLRVPQGGVWLERLTSPPMLALLAFALIATGSGTATRRSRKRRKATMSKHTSTTSSSSTAALESLPTSVRALAAGTAAIAGMGVVLAALAWGGPLEHSSAAQSPSGAKMIFSYTADVGSSAAYDGTIANSPDPIFRKITDTVDVHFAYQGEPGTITVTAELSTPSGWRSTVPLEDSEAFTSDRYEGTAQLDLDELEAKARAAAEVTGLPSEQVSIALIPTVDPISGPKFEPALELQLTPLHLTLPGGAESLTVADSAVTEEPRVIARTIGTESINVTAGTAREISGFLLLGAALLGAVTFVLVRRATPLNESEIIHRRYKSLLVSVIPKDIPNGHEVIDVTAFAELAKLAERYEEKVLHSTHNGVETFTVKDQSAIYRYRIVSGPMEEAVSPLVGANA